MIIVNLEIIKLIELAFACISADKIFKCVNSPTYFIVRKTILDRSLTWTKAVAFEPIKKSQAVRY